MGRFREFAGAVREVRKPAQEVTGPTPYRVLPCRVEGVAVARPEFELRCYGTEQARVGAAPVVLVPPLMARAELFDLYEGRSMVDHLIARGYPVYLVDWAPRASDVEVGLDDYVCRWMPAVLEAVCEDHGVEQVSLVGYCLGGLFCLWHLASDVALSERVRDLVLVASPVDAHRAGALMDLTRLAGWPIEVVGRRIGSIPGPLSGVVFRMTSPVRNVTRWGQLWMRRGDSEFVEGFAAMNAWMGNFTDFPQRAFLELMREHVVENQCARGYMRIGGQRIDLGRVDVPILAIAGESDKIVDADAVWAVRDAVASREVETKAAPGGHAGVIAGRSAPAGVWDVIADWLESHEQS